MTPKRIQLRRTKGWRKPEGAIVVSRPSKWGNPFTVKSCMEEGFAADIGSARSLVVSCYRSWLTEGDQSPWWFEAGRAKFDHITGPDLRCLAGHDLACWCPLDQPCHADVLLELANPIGEPA